MKKQVLVVADDQYAAGSTLVFMSGMIQKVLPSVGRVVVSGLTVDLTGTMWKGTGGPGFS